MGGQGDPDYSVGGVDTSQSGESGIIMGTPVNPLSSGIGGVADDSAVITPTWFKSSSG